MAENNLMFLEVEREHTGFGQDISTCMTSEEAIEAAGLNWTVGPRDVFYYNPQDGFLTKVPKMKTIVREEDGKSLGIVSEKYKVVQNNEAFSFTEELLDSGVRYVKGGSFRGGRSVWLMAEMPEDRIILGDPVHQYLVFTNSHDGSGAVRVMIAPNRIACSNALNLFCRKATRKWSCTHMGEIAAKLEEARETLVRTDVYMTALNEECERLQGIVINDHQVGEIIRDIFPYAEKMTDKQKAKIDERRLRLSDVYYQKSDLAHLGNTAYRMINAVSDYVTHARPERRTRDYDSNLFEKTIGGHPMIDAVAKRFAA